MVAAPTQFCAYAGANVRWRNNGRRPAPKKGKQRGSHTFFGTCCEQATFFCIIVRFSGLEREARLAMRRFFRLSVCVLIATCAAASGGAAVEFGYINPYYGGGNFENCYRLRRYWTREGWRRQWKNICNNSGAYGAPDPGWRWW